MLFLSSRWRRALLAQAASLPGTFAQSCSLTSIAEAMGQAVSPPQSLDHPGALFGLRAARGCKHHLAPLDFSLLAPSPSPRSKSSMRRRCQIALEISHRLVQTTLPLTARRELQGSSGSPRKYVDLRERVRPLACEMCASWPLQRAHFVRSRTHAFTQMCPRAAQSPARHQMWKTRNASWQWHHPQTGASAGRLGSGVEADGCTWKLIRNCCSIEHHVDGSK